MRIAFVATSVEKLMRFKRVVSINWQTARGPFWCHIAVITLYFVRSRTFRCLCRDNERHREIRDLHCHQGLVWKANASFLEAVNHDGGAIDVSEPLKEALFFLLIGSKLLFAHRDVLLGESKVGNVFQLTIQRSPSIVFAVRCFVCGSHASEGREEGAQTHSSIPPKIANWPPNGGERK